MDEFLHFEIYRSVLKVAGFMVGLFAHVFLQADSEIYNIDGSKGLKRDSEHGFAYANFALHNSRYLNITPLVSVRVKQLSECEERCAVHSLCFSVNIAEFLHQNGRILRCELLPSDKYNNLNKFVYSTAFQHLSIKVSKTVYFKLSSAVFIHSFAT